MVLEVNRKIPPIYGRVGIDPSTKQRIQGAYIFRNDKADRVEYMVVSGPQKVMRNSEGHLQFDFRNQHCRNCFGSFDLTNGQGFYIPTHYEPNTKRYYLSNIAVHNGACGARYLLDRATATNPTQIACMWQMLSDHYNQESTLPAPALDALTIFNGPVTPEEYVHHGSEVLIRALPECMVPQHVVMELRTKLEHNMSSHAHARDPARVRWGLKGLQRPPDIPLEPQVQTKPRNSYFDYYIQQHFGGKDGAAKSPTLMTKFGNKPSTTATAAAAVDDSTNLSTPSSPASLQRKKKKKKGPSKQVTFNEETQERGTSMNRETVEEAVGVVEENNAKKEGEDKAKQENEKEEEKEEEDDDEIQPNMASVVGAVKRSRSTYARRGTKRTATEAHMASSNRHHKQRRHRIRVTPLSKIVTPKTRAQHARQPLL
jgi:hypothetical protein